MCGFFGVVSFKKKISAEDIEDIKKGTEEIRYRGPDDQKILSDEKRGPQVLYPYHLVAGSATGA